LKKSGISLYSCLNLHKKKNKGKLSNCEIARLFKVTESTIRYHLRREKENAVDKRKDKTDENYPLRSYHRPLDKEEQE